MPAQITGAPRRRQRLDSLKNPAAPAVYTPQLTPPSAPTDEGEPPCTHPETSEEQNGDKVCMSCGKVVGTVSSLQAEIQFGETSSGAAMVVGGLIRDGQRHADTMGGTVAGIRGMSTEAVERGQIVVRNLGDSLGLKARVTDVAQKLYRLASNHNFIQGRRIKNVAACCLYLADRKEPESTLLLMDLAERCSVNVWALGDTYKQLLECLMEKDPGDNLDGLHKIPQLEPLVLKFCRKLEFGIDSHRVAEDACRLLKRMKRDWMVDGRQPAGIIGAAIILAARMNNFRRTVREVVYCVKVADSTINQRLYEFRRTKSSNLTLSQWREYGLRLKDDVLPPAIYRRKEKEERKKRKLAALAGETEDISAYAQSLSANSPTRSQAKVTKKRKTTKATAQATASDSGSTQTDRDDNGFLIPDIPLNPQARPQDTMDFESEDHLEYVAAAAAPEEQLEDVEEEPLPLPKKRGRPAKVRKPIVIREDDLEIEAEIETDMQHNLRAWEHVFQEIKNSESHPVLQAAEDTAQALVREHMTTNVPETEIVGEDEFEDDPDVANCVNSPAEVAIKEKVWITQNEEWLREQQEKMLKKELQEAEGKTKKPKRKRKRYQMGDGSVLEGQPAASAAEAVSKMLQKRSNFSAHLNYDIVQSLFNMTGADNSAATSANGGSPAIAATPVAAASPAMSGASAQPTQHQPATEVQQDGEDEGDYDEEEEEVEEVYDEPIDDENQYMSEEEYGFDDMNDDF